MSKSYAPTLTKYEVLEPIMDKKYDIKRVFLPTQFEPIIRARRIK